MSIVLYTIFSARSFYCAFEYRLCFPFIFFIYCSHGNGWVCTWKYNTLSTRWPRLANERGLLIINNNTRSYRHLRFCKNNIKHCVPRHNFMHYSSVCSGLMLSADTSISIDGRIKFELKSWRYFAHSTTSSTSKWTLRVSSDISSLEIFLETSIKTAWSLQNKSSRKIDDSHVDA